MSATSLLANEIAQAFIHILETDEALSARLRARLSLVPERPEVLFATVAHYAQRLGFSRRTVEHMIRDGLPTIGVGSGLRIDIERGDAWVRLRRAPKPEVSIDEAVERGRAAAAHSKRSKPCRPETNTD